MIIKKDKILDNVSWSIMILSLLLLRVKSSYLENIVHGKEFVGKFVLVGILLATLWIFLLYKINKPYFEGRESRASAIVCQFFSIIVITLCFSAFYNYRSGKINVIEKKAIVVRKSTNAKYKTRYVHLLMDNRQERFSPSSAEYQLLKEKDTTLLRVGQGNLGYDFILSFTILYHQKM